MHASKKESKKETEFSIEIVSTVSPKTEDLLPIMNKDGTRPAFDVVETETEVAITIRKAVLHVTEPRGQNSFARNIRKSLRSGQDAHAHLDGSLLRHTGPRTSTLEIPLDGLKEIIEAAQAKGKAVRLCRPTEGIPVFIGKDVDERYEALQRKRQR